MDVGLSDEYLAFQADIRSFLASRWRPEYLQDMGALRAFKKDAISTGLLYRHIPVEYGGGGGGYDPIRSSIVQREFRAAGAPGETTSMDSVMGAFMRRSDAACQGHGVAEESIHRVYAAWGHRLVPGLQRAWRRLRPCCDTNQGAAGR